MVATWQPWPAKPLDLEHVAHHAFWGLHAWRVAGLMLALKMPGVDDILPRYWEQMEHVPGPFKHMCSRAAVATRRLRPLPKSKESVQSAPVDQSDRAPDFYVSFEIIRGGLT